MPKPIPKGGKRVIQVKVNFNEPEIDCLDKLVTFYKSDRSSTLRKLLIKWNNLERYVVSIEEVKSKVSDICKNNDNKLSSDILDKLYSLIDIANLLSDESSESDKFKKRKLVNTFSDSLNSQKQIESKAKIVILKLFDVDEGHKIIDYLQEGNSVICDFSEFRMDENGFSDEFNFLLGGIYAIKAKTEKINQNIYVFTPKTTNVDNLSKKIDPIQNYLVNILKFPLLSSTEEIELAHQVQKMRLILETSPKKMTSKSRQIIKLGKKARDKIMASNLRLVVSVAKKYQNQGLELLELVQEGAIGLEKAVDKFDPTQGYRFSTYAYWWIRQGMTRAISNRSFTKEKAIDDFDKALESDPKYRDAFNNRGEIKRDSGIYQEAMKDIKIFLNLN